MRRAAKLYGEGKMREMLQTPAFWAAIAAALVFAAGLTTVRQILRKIIFREETKKERDEK